MTTNSKHNKPIALFNINGYYDCMEKMMQNAIDCNFVMAECKSLYKIFTDIDEMLDYIENYDEDFADIVKVRGV